MCALVRRRDELAQRAAAGRELDALHIVQFTCICAYTKKRGITHENRREGRARRFSRRAAIASSVRRRACGVQVFGSRERRLCALRGSGARRGEAEDSSA